MPLARKDIVVFPLLGPEFGVISCGTKLKYPVKLLFLICIPYLKISKLQAVRDQLHTSKEIENWYKPATSAAKIKL